MTLKSALSFLMIAIFVLAVPADSDAASKKKIDRRVAKAMEEFHENVKGSHDILSRASGYLVFPRITKAGIAVGGEYGEGALIVNGETVGYYSTAAASFGFQLGGQRRRQMILFMTDRALENFRESNGWEIGADASVAVITLDAGGAVDTTTLDRPVVAFVFDNKGLMYNLTLEGSKISQIDR